MNYYIKKESEQESMRLNAGSKAVNDIESILQDNGCDPIYVYSDEEKRSKAGLIKKVLFHFQVKNMWEKQLSNLRMGDAVVIQLPLYTHTLLFNSVIKSVINRGVTVVGLVHDLESIRWLRLKSRWSKEVIRAQIEEIQPLKNFSAIIVHNSSMQKYIEQKYRIESDKIYCLDCFDYLTSGNDGFKKRSKTEPVIIAGNLSPEKSPYTAILPKEPEYNLYGLGFEGEACSNIHYKGAFPPEILPAILEGSFGLVWDGDSVETCHGVSGEYLKYNNPHKTSLYLSAGIPVIVWSKAAMADFVLREKCGITVDSLYDIPEIIKTISDPEYEDLCLNAGRIGEKLRSGFYTKTAIAAVFANRSDSCF